MLRMVLVLLSIAGLARAQSVYPGCAVPPTSFTSIIKVTPPTLASSLAEAQAHPGSELLLQTGYYPLIRIQGWFGDHHPETLRAWNLAGWTTFAPAPGASPVIGRIMIVGGDRLAFRSLQVKSQNTTGKWLTSSTNASDYYLIGVIGPHSDLIFDSMNVKSADKPFKTQEDWLKQRGTGFGESRGNCVAVTNSRFTVVGNGIQTGQSTNILLKNNIIDYFSDDGVDFGDTNLDIINNHISNSVEDNDGMHRDGMQGQPITERTVNSNLVFDHNVITRDADPNNPFPAYLQCYDAFDGLWTNVTLSNNQCSTTASQGIAFYGVTGISITGNTLTQDTGRVMEPGSITTITNLSVPPRVTVTHAKAGMPSGKVSVIGNTAAGFGIDGSTTELTGANNHCNLSPKCVVCAPIEGATHCTAKRGSYPANAKTPWVTIP